MKNLTIFILFTALSTLNVFGQAGYKNWLRQVNFPSKNEHDINDILPSGSALSKEGITEGGARFELHTVKSDPLTSYLLDTSLVGSFVPLAQVTIVTEDRTGTIPRTRADRPFTILVKVEGLYQLETDPEASKKVTFHHHAQAYGPGGIGTDIVRSQAILIEQATINTTGTKTYIRPITVIPDANRAKVRGEERFSIFSLADYQRPASQLASQFVQIWPLSEATLSGIAANQLIRYTMPDLTLSYKDLYPGSTSYLQAYKGEQVLGTTGVILTESQLVNTEGYPLDRVLTVNDYDEIFTSDGRWTMEVITESPFGKDRLQHITFEVDRTIEVNGSFTTIE